eukprot:3037985-Rhodomonas_salina.1
MQTASKQIACWACPAWCRTSTQMQTNASFNASLCVGPDGVSPLAGFASDPEDDEPAPEPVPEGRVRLGSDVCDADMHRDGAASHGRRGQLPQCHRCVCAPLRSSAG